MRLSAAGFRIGDKGCIAPGDALSGMIGFRRQKKKAAATRASAATHSSARNDDAQIYEQWLEEHEDDACDRARRLLSRREAPWRRVGDRFARLRHEIGSRRWLRRVFVTTGSLALAGLLGFGLLWWRLGAGPVGIDMVTPWLAAAIEDNFGAQHRVAVGGTQIERDEDGHVAVRIRDIVVRDGSNAIVASAPKAEVRVSGTGLLTGRLRAGSLNLVGAELSIRLAADGRVTVSAGADAKPIATSPAPVAQPQGTPSQGAASAPSQPGVQPGNMQGLSAALAWIDGLTASGLDGYDLSELGLKNGTLTVDDQQSGNRWTFENITLSLRRPSGGGVIVQVGEDVAERAWMLRAAVGPPRDGVRGVDIMASNVSTRNILLALRMSDLSYTADVPLSGRIRGEIGGDGFPTFLSGRIVADAGAIIDRKVPEYPMTIDRAEFNIDWDANRRTMVAPFQVVSGANRLTLLAHLEPPNEVVPHWQLGLSGGTVLLSGGESEPPLIFNRVAVRIRFDTNNKKILLERADIGNGETGLAGSGSIDYSGAEPRLVFGMAGTPMPVLALKRAWPITVAPEVREWVIGHVESGSVQKLEIGVNAPMNTLVRGGPPIPEEGLSIDIVANNAAVRPIAELPPIRGADLRTRVTGRTTTVSVGQGSMETAGGRKLTVSDLVFEVPDMHQKPPQARARFRVEGPVPAVAEILSNEKFLDATSNPVDPNASRGNVTAQVTMGLPLKKELAKNDVVYTVAADLSSFSADRVIGSQKLEANLAKVTANAQGIQVRGDVRINGIPASLDYRKPVGPGDADLRLQATLDDVARGKLGLDLGSSITGSIPVKMNGKIAANGDQRLAIEADLAPARIDNALPGWVKPQGRPGRMTFNLVQKAQSTRFEDISIDGGGTQIRGAVEVDQNSDLVSANFPTFNPSEGDKTSLRADRTNDGTLKVTLRGDVFDGRNFIKSAVSGSSKDQKAKQDATANMDLEVKLGAVAGFHGEALRSLDVKMSKRNGLIRTFAMNGRIGANTPITGDMRGRAGGRDVVFVETNDAGAFFRLTDTYARMYGGSMWVALEPPGADSNPREGLLNVRDFKIRGEAALDRVVAGGPAAQGDGVPFSRMRVEFARLPGEVIVREGLVQGPIVGATIDGQVDYARDQVRMRGTFVPLYGLNNMFGQIPIVGLILGGGSNEGLVGVTFEVVGSPGQPVLRVNPISAVAPGLFRKIFEFPNRTSNQPDAYAPSR